MSVVYTQMMNEAQFRQLIKDHGLGEFIALGDPGEDRTFLFECGTLVDSHGFIQPVAPGSREAYQGRKKFLRLRSERASEAFEKLRNESLDQARYAANEGMPVPFDTDKRVAELIAAEQKAQTYLAGFEEHTREERAAEQRRLQEEEATRSRFAAEATNALSRIEQAAGMTAERLAQQREFESMFDLLCTLAKDPDMWRCQVESGFIRPEMEEAFGEYALLLQSGDFDLQQLSRALVEASERLRQVYEAKFSQETEEQSDDASLRD